RLLRGVRVVCLHAIRGALRARAHRDPGGPPRANLGGAAGARVEPAPVTATMMKSRKGVIAAVMVLVGLPVLVVLVEAVWLYVANRSDGSCVPSGEKR